MMNNPNGFTGPVNLGNPHEFTILELAEQVIRLTGSRSKIVFKPLPADDPTQRRPDIALAQRRARLAADDRARGGAAADHRLFQGVRGSAGSGRRRLIRPFANTHPPFIAPRKEAVLMSTRKPLLGLLALALSLALLSGCALFEKSPPKPEPTRLPDQREFEDVMVPRDMEIDKDASAVYRRDGMSLGILRMSGRVDGSSLLRYFQNNMSAEGWRQVSMLRAPQSLMVFQKANRMAVLAVDDSDMMATYADLWVVPLNDTFDGLAPKK